MIYASTSKNLNISVQRLWQKIEDFIKSPEQGRYITSCTVLESYYDGFIRSSVMQGEGELKERVFLLKEQNKAVIRLEDHPLFIGDLIFQIVSSDQEILFDKKSTLCVVLAWRMRPGIIEAPYTDKQHIVDDLLDSISAE